MKTNRQLAYAAYLRSPEWATKREYIINSRGGMCQMCGSTENLNVHHVTYDRVGAELEADLELLCGYHHECVHQLEWARNKKEKAFNTWFEKIYGSAPDGYDRECHWDEFSIWYDRVNRSVL